jgi:hypothetical protein
VGVLPLVLLHDSPYVMFLPTSNSAREWWASVGAAARAIPTTTARPTTDGERESQLQPSGSRHSKSNRGRPVADASTE